MAPGIDIIKETLIKNTFKLDAPNKPLHESPFIGLNTADAINAGLRSTIDGQISCTINRMNRNLKGKSKGGYGKSEETGPSDWST